MTMGVKADGSGEIVWKHPVKCYEQSLLAHDGYIYGSAENGVLYCWRASDGQEMWKQRFERQVSASPVLAGGHIYISAENGNTLVFKPNPDRYEEVAKNQLGGSAYATPTFVENKIIARVAEGGIDSQEWLYCIGMQ